MEDMEDIKKLIKDLKKDFDVFVVCDETGS